MKKNRQKKIWERLTPLSKDDRSWDIAFWQTQSPSARLEAAWGMVRDFYRLKGKKVDAHKLRLQRSVENIKRA